jgi:hypothetical protein
MRLVAHTARLESIATQNHGFDLSLATEPTGNGKSRSLHPKLEQPFREIQRVQEDSTGQSGESITEK